MKTFNACFYGKNFSKALIVAVLMGILSIKDTMATPLLTADSFLLATTPAPDEFMASSYHLQNSLKMVVHLVNPTQSPVTVSILGSNKQVVYKTKLGNPAAFACIFNMKELPDDDYTLVVQSESYTYSKPFSLQTDITRVVKVQGNGTYTPKQEAI